MAELFTNFDLLDIVNAVLLLLAGAGVFVFLRKYINAFKEGVEFLQAIAAAVLDGSVTAEEKDKILKELAELKTALKEAKKKKEG